MPESIPDCDARITRLERRLRAWRRDNAGLADAGRQVLQNPEDTCAFESRLQRSLRDWSHFVETWEELAELKDMVRAEFPDAAWQRVYDGARDEIRDAEALLMRIQRQQRAQAPPPAAQGEPALNATVFNPAKPQLPKIPIPTFSGDRLKWTHFRDTFLSLVHNEPTLSNVEKFHYLVGALKGEAAVLLSRFPLEDESYQLAWEKVVKTYDNPRVLASILVRRIVDRDLKPIKSEHQKYSLFLTDVADSVEAFRALRLDDPCEFLLTTLVLRALDHTTRRQFEMSIAANTFPTAEDVINFVRQRKSALEMSQGIGQSSSIDSGPSHRSVSSSSRARYPNRSSPRYEGVSFHTTSTAHRQSSNSQSSASTRSSSPRSRRCPMCKGDHYLYRCQEFALLPVEKRIPLVNAWKICSNCLNKGHRVAACRSRFRCRNCQKSHHSLIHQEAKQSTAPRAQSSTQADKRESSTSQQPSSFIGMGSVPTSTITSVLLGTASVLVKGRRGYCVPARALLDSGSQHSFITSSLATAIGVQVAPFSGSITGLAGCAVPNKQLKGVTSCTLRPYEGQPVYEVSPIVVDHITGSLPSRDLPSHITDALLNQPLADHRFGVSSPIDLLIGSDLHNQLICGESRHAGVDGLYLLQTKFGLVVSGQFQSQRQADSTSVFLAESQPSVEAHLKKFWELEEPMTTKRADPDDQYCEQHFSATTSRTPEGRYMVRLPFKHGVPTLGQNRDAVLRRFHALEHKFRKNPDLASHYFLFMQEYLTLGHMSLAPNPAAYLIPHHGVWSEGAQGPKLRVVFDASCPSSALSLNDMLLSGPKLQNDLCNVLNQFRLYAIPLCADIVKMYRQILMHPDDRKFQRILWRNDSYDAVQEMELNTVTYGVKSSAFQAIGVIRQLVIDEGPNYPLAAKRVITDMYVDDLVSGADSMSEALQLQQQLVALFQRGGFSLGKWASTAAELLPTYNDNVDSISLTPSDDGSLKILGLAWNSRTDTFSYTVSAPPSHHVTKRAMLSAIARIFDPLGLLAPVIFTAKTLIQELWKEQIGWDEVLPDNIAQSWGELTREWHVLATITIPRYISARGSLHFLIGFCDASERGYAAALYLRIQAADGSSRSSLMKAKTKVAPVKYHSIARLELCGALLLSRLVASISRAVYNKLICFTDSKVVLAWINTPTHELKVFEANRVDQILTTVPAKNWHHVKSRDNPADLASRGCSPSVLRKDSLWWTGPDWLRHPLNEWLPPTRDSIALSTLSQPRQNEATTFDWISNMSSVPVAVRTMARLCRLLPGHSTSSCPGHVSTEEYLEAEIRCLRFIQHAYFPKELYCKSTGIPKPYAQLTPFTDERGIIRVGGRLEYAELKPASKHPILLPRKAPFSRMIIEQIHRTHFHAGPSLTLALLRGKYWIPGALQLIRSCLNKCVPCRLRKAKSPTPLMAPLPPERVTGSKAFTNVGVDYAGPFLIKESNRRNAATVKAYLCLFVCMASKALHLEVVSSLSTPAFLSALERFVSRRGLPQSIWSDHGTNFIGASRFLKDVYKFQRQAEHDIGAKLAVRGIKWMFIPPRAPHFGGLWEAGVKSAKNLLAGSIGKQPHTLEELMTVFARIEALLNSRPLCALKEDTEDFDFLTPGHFLIGTALCALPEPSSPQASSSSHHARWEILQANIARVWNRWRKEYLHCLQQRNKWSKHTPSLQVGDLAILQEKRALLGQWPVGRVLETFPGRDGIVRTVTIRTPSGSVLTRAVTSLVPLFCSKTEES